MQSVLERSASSDNAHGACGLLQNDMVQVLAAAFLRVMGSKLPVQYCNHSVLPIAWILHGQIYVHIGRVNR